MVGRAKENLPGGSLKYQFVYENLYIWMYLPYIMRIFCGKYDHQDLVGGSESIYRWKDCQAKQHQRG